MATNEKKEDDNKIEIQNADMVEDDIKKSEEVTMWIDYIGRHGRGTEDSAPGKKN